MAVVFAVGLTHNLPGFFCDNQCSLFSLTQSRVLFPKSHAFLYMNCSNNTRMQLLLPSGLSAMASAVQNGQGWSASIVHGRCIVAVVSKIPRHLSSSEAVHEGAL